MPEVLDAAVVGSGPNGLAAAIELARHGYSVTVFEAAPTPGGGMRSSELTLPGFIHDQCSAIHPTGLLSPFFRQLPLAAHGLEWLPFEASVAHPLPYGPAPILYRSFETTAERLGPDGQRWRELLKPFLEHSEDLFEDLFGPLRFKVQRPVQMARFGWVGVRSAASVARSRFEGVQAQALFAGCAGHAVLPLDALTTAAVAMVFCISAHVADWPCVRGGTGRLAKALTSYLLALGGEIELGQPIRSMHDLPERRVTLFDLTPRPFLQIAGDVLPRRYKDALSQYHYGPGTFKVDWALDGPIPWRDPEVGKASTVHVGGTLEEIMISEREAWEGRPPESPYLIVCQQSLVDPTRAPDNKHTGYAYCHVPNGSEEDMTDRIEAQIERFAPGFRDVILARHVTAPRSFEATNPNYVGGAVTGGAADITQLFTRPVARLNPYTTPNPRIFLCSASTPPGGGVHGMCGYWAAQAAMRRLRNA